MPVGPTFCQQPAVVHNGQVLAERNARRSASSLPLTATVGRGQNRAWA